MELMKYQNSGKNKRRSYMMKVKTILYLWILLLLPFVCSGQMVIEDRQLASAVNESPQEKVFIHFNTSFLLAGEYLCYKAYVLNSETLTPSQISSVAYIELQGESGETVFRHKVALENGAGEGDFFVSTDVPSGNYKLLGYTRWMLNGEKEELFQGDVVLVNSYSNDQEALLSSLDNEEYSAERTQSGASVQKKESVTSPELKTYGKREHVELNLNGMEDLDPNGNYSVSVKKVHDIVVPKIGFSKDISAEGKFFNVEPGEQFYLPELRGELFRGKLVAKDGNNLLSSADKKVALSIPGQNFILKISRTTENGEFFFNVENYNLAEEVILQVLGEEKANFEIVIDPPPKIDTSDLQFGDFQLTPEIEDLILQESVYNQIENAYFTIKPDTLKLPEQKLPFYGDRMSTYNLDDYTRFNTLQETFVEIVREITISGEMLKIRGYDPLVDSKMPPLLIVDGIIVQDHGQFIDFPARRIQSIGVLRDKYFYGPEVFHGIVNVETIEGDFQEKLETDFFTTTLLRPQPEKKYFRQTYNEGEIWENIPDFRRQLLWAPDFDPSTGSIEFYTSDVAGEYEIILQGFTSSGKGITLREKILVEENSRE